MEVFYATHVRYESAINRAMTIFRKQPEPNYQTPQIYLRIELARRLRASALCALASATRLARIWAYSFWIPLAHTCWSLSQRGSTYRLILHLLGLATLERDAVALVLQALGSDQTLNARSLGVRLLALALGLDLTPNDVLANLLPRRKNPVLASALALRLYPN